MPDASTDDPRALLGRWRLQRKIDDRLTDTRMLVVGEATFATVGPGLLEWREMGILHHPSGDLPVQALRRLRRASSGAWLVEFADGREFHAWQPGPELVHACAPDDYRGRIVVGQDAAAPLTWRMRWAATGPAKDHVIETRYERLDAPL